MARDHADEALGRAVAAALFLGDELGVAGLRAAGCKWQSGSPDNHAMGQPYITGQFILNALDAGLPMAIMDST